MDSAEAPEPPELLYKYYSLAPQSEGYTRRALTHREVFFSHRALFNDKADCRPAVSGEATEEEWRKLFRGMVESNETVRVSERAVVIEQLLQRQRANPEQNRAEFEGFLNNALDSLGILCLSETPSDPVMWAHYADSHKGLCVAYQSLPQLFTRELKGYRACKVNYQAERPCIRAVDGTPGNKDSGQQMVQAKSSAWSYEREWRIVNYNGYGVWRLRDQFIAEVILGADADKETMALVREWLLGYRIWRPAIKKARLAEGSYLLDAALVEPAVSWTSKMSFGFA